jgi:hypothetical protein
MSNLDTAKSAIQAELAQAKQGLAYYQSHVAALESALVQLGSLGVGTVLGRPGGAKRGRKPGKISSATITKPAKAARGRPAKAKKGRALKGPNDLPFTGGDYWPNLVTSEPQSASEILHAAVAGLGFAPSAEQVKKLAQRMTFVLNALVKSKALRDSGSGRNRRFFK